MIYTLYRTAINEVITVIKAKKVYGFDLIHLINNECDAAIDRAYSKYVADTKIIHLHAQEIKDKYYDSLCNAIIDRLDAYL